MKIRSIKCLLAVIALTAAGPGVAQYSYFKPMEGYGIEVSLSNTSLLRMPMYRNAITSLTVKGDYIIGGTSAAENLTPYLFVASMKSRDIVSIKDLNEAVPGQRSIRSGFFKSATGGLFAGTMANNETTGAKQTEPAGSKPVTSAGSGHLLKVDIGQGGAISVADLGIPLKGEGVFALTGNDSTKMLYGITYPSGTFFSYDINGKKFKVYDSSAVPASEYNTLRFEYHQQPDEYLAGALVVDNKGLVYLSQPINKLVVFNPADESFKTISDLPEVWGRRTFGRTESWTRAADGTLYGGNAGDGQLFSVDAASQKIKNLGKPAMMTRLRGLCIGADKKIYGLSGALPGYVHLFSYNPAGEGFTDLGNPQFILKAPGISQGIEWRGFQLATIAASEDGKFIVMGEDEALSQLLVFPVTTE